MLGLEWVLCSWIGALGVEYARLESFYAWFGLLVAFGRCIGRFGVGRFRREISRLYDPLAFQSKNPQSGISSLWGFVSLNDSVRFNQSVFTVSTFVYDVCTIGFRIGEDEEIVAEHVHLENGFILIHRFQIELFRTYDRKFLVFL